MELQAPNSRWLGVPWQQDAAEVQGSLSENGKWDQLIFDHYALNSCWEVQQRKRVKRIMVIDNLADRKHDCDLLLDHNLLVGELDGDAVEVLRYDL